MNYGTCQRKNAKNTTEGVRLLKYNEDWKNTLNKLMEAEVFGETKYDSLMQGNFSAAIIKWANPGQTLVAGPRKHRMINEPEFLDGKWLNVGNNVIKRPLRADFYPGQYIPVLPINPKTEKVIFSCSRISNENKKMPFKHELGKEFYEKLIINENKDYEFSYINVDDYRSIGFGHERHNDSEAKLLEHINLFVKEKKLEEFTVHLFTQLEPCLSCDYLIIEFLESFPKSNMYLYYEHAYNKLIINEE